MLRKVDIISMMETSQRDLGKVSEGRYNFGIQIPGMDDSQPQIGSFLEQLVDYPLLDLDGYEAILLTKRTKLKKLVELFAKICDDPGDDALMFNRDSYLLLPKKPYENCTLLISKNKNVPAIKFDAVNDLEAAQDPRFLFPVLYYRNKEYKIPEWVEDEDRKAKTKLELAIQKSKKTQKKQPAKKVDQKNKKQEKPIIEKSQLQKKNREKDSSYSDAPASQLELDYSDDDAEWVTVEKKKTKKKKEETPIKQKKVSGAVSQEEVLKNEMEKDFRRLEMEVKDIRKENLSSTNSIAPKLELDNFEEAVCQNQSIEDDQDLLKRETEVIEPDEAFHDSKKLAKENIAKKNLEVNRINSSDSFSAQFVISAAKNLTQPRNRDNIETVLEKSLPFMTSQSLWFTIQEMDEEHKYFEKFF
ncbi:Oidioi.mRNA.OKI2018_I69.XSR.g16629.t1.cds [Oikopleura dioica]|uniref:Oidioi.mRNA.OKI2018_I69.XSR.g16629.t1.cds n=1 Tax=Oikopleura dioica TaxID=34765 RepID=A0ABN7SIK2_OIKDI|nr:Oidioi.mRNA.OKI2018_I69.XSR.g16629.t1.cds [Oikopleura dioica]